MIMGKRIQDLTDDDILEIYNHTGYDINVLKYKRNIEIRKDRLDKINKIKKKIH